MYVHVRMYTVHSHSCATACMEEGLAAVYLLFHYIKKKNST